MDFYNFAYYNEPIVAGLIMSSGTALVPIRSYDTGHSNFSFVAMHVGCGTTSDAAAELECMRRVPAETLEQFLRRYLDSGVEPTIAFEPIADDKIVFTNYTERALAGQLADIVSNKTRLSSQQVEKQPASDHRHHCTGWPSIRAV